MNKTGFGKRLAPLATLASFTSLASLAAGLCFANPGWAAGDVAVNGGVIGKFDGASYSRPTPVQAVRIDSAARTIEVDVLRDSAGICYGELQLERLPNAANRVAAVARYQDSGYLCVSPWRPDGIKYVVTTLKASFEELGLDASAPVEVCNLQDARETVGMAYLVDESPAIEKWINARCNGSRRGGIFETKSAQMKAAAARSFAQLGMSVDPVFDTAIMSENIDRISQLMIIDPRAGDLQGLTKLKSLSWISSTLPYSELAAVPELTWLWIASSKASVPAELFSLLPHLKSLSVLSSDDAPALGGWASGSFSLENLYLYATPTEKEMTGKVCEVFRDIPGLKTLTLHALKHKRAECR